MKLRVEWDPGKAQINKKKHRVSFEDAVTAFTDPHGVRIPDPEHSIQDERYILLGMTWTHRLLVVSHCFREGSEVIRIISARPASGNERAQYVVGKR